MKKGTQILLLKRQAKWAQECGGEEEEEVEKAQIEGDCCGESSIECHFPLYNADHIA